jgi:hypothetical protein
MADTALTILLRRRFTKFLFRVSGRPPRAVVETDSISDITGFAADDVVDLEVRRRLDDDDGLGMGDIVRTHFLPGEFGTGTTLATGTALVAAHASVQTHGEYKALVQPRIQRDFRQAVADVAGRPLADVRADLPLDQFIGAGQRAALVTETASRLDKFLLTKLDETVLTGTIQQSVDGLVALMLIRR